MGFAGDNILLRNGYYPLENNAINPFQQFWKSSVVHFILCTALNDWLKESMATAFLVYGDKLVTAQCDW